MSSFPRIPSDALGCPRTSRYNDSFGETYMHYFSTEEGAAGLHDMDTFFAQAKEGTLPTLTWITPREGVNASLGVLGGPNSDHPSCCDVALGERLRKDIYEGRSHSRHHSHVCSSAYPCPEVLVVTPTLILSVCLCVCLSVSPHVMQLFAAVQPGTRPHSS